MALEDGTTAAEACPSGTTTGSYDAVMLPIEEVGSLLEPIRGDLCGLTAADQIEVDDRLEARCLKEGRVVGANVTAAVSMAVCRAAARTSGYQLYEYVARMRGTRPEAPRLLLNVINGGEHSHSGLAVTECMIVSTGDVASGLQKASRVYTTLRDLVAKEYSPAATNTGLEGGFTPPILRTEDVLDLITRAIDAAGCTGMFGLGLDVAANSLRCEEGYELNGLRMDSTALIGHWKQLAAEHPTLHYLEDPLADDDNEGWHGLRHELSPMIVGDDVLATSTARLLAGASRDGFDGVILKVNQCGTLTRLFECFDAARRLGLSTIASQRSRETDSDFLTHLALGLGTDYLKAGACARERIVKYNSLLRLLAELDQPGAAGVGRAS